MYRVRMKLRGMNTRLEFTVNPMPRREGDLPQLLRVVNKGK
jgi:hypothetical protein